LSQSGSESGNGIESGRRRLGTGIGIGIGSEIENVSVSVITGGCEIGCSWHLFQWAWLVQALLGPLKQKMREEKRELEPDWNEKTV
jgi:hypothetical protein